MATQAGPVAPRTAELDWLNANRGEVTSRYARYAGKVIAIAGERVVADAADVASVMRLAREAGYRDPLVLAIPREPVTKLCLEASA